MITVSVQVDLPDTALTTLHSADELRTLVEHAITDDPTLTITGPVQANAWYVPPPGVLRNTAGWRT